MIVSIEILSNELIAATTTGLFSSRKLSFSLYMDPITILQKKIRYQASKLVRTILKRVTNQ
jgi:hypothetical protein